MRVRVVEGLVTKTGIVPTGKILDISPEMFLKLGCKVKALPPETKQEASHGTKEQPSIVPTTCQAVKLVRGGGYRLCGAPLREGKNGFRSCSHPGCQIPVESWGKYDHLRRHLP